jgi:signal peptidase II
MQATTGTPLSDESDPARGVPELRRRRLLRVWLLVATVAYALDQLTKWWAQRSLTEGVPRPLVGDLVRLDLTHNAGAAFSVGTGYTILLTGVALVVVVACLRLAGRLGSRGWAVALGLLLGGALGNVTDRIFRSPGPFRGHVVDFLQLPHWPVFNVADVCINVAAAVIVIQAFRGVSHTGERTGADERTGGTDPRHRRQGDEHGDPGAS